MGATTGITGSSMIAGNGDMWHHWAKLETIVGTYGYNPFSPNCVHRPNGSVWFRSRRGNLCLFDEEPQPCQTDSKPCVTIFPSKKGEGFMVANNGNFMGPYDTELEAIEAYENRVKINVNITIKLVD